MVDRLESMANDYRRVMADAVERPAPHVENLPSHVTDDYTSLARRLSNEMGIRLDLLSWLDS